MQNVVFLVFQRSCAASVLTALHSDLLFLGNHIGMLKFYRQGRKKREREMVQWAESLSLRSYRYLKVAVVSITNHYSPALPWPVGPYISMSLTTCLLYA